jgi:CorA-like Mg2+ transporter protein
MVDSTREILATALEANFSLISISENEIQKRFAGWAAILAVPTMIAGIYGMNFKFMPELKVLRLSCDSLRHRYPVRADVQRLQAGGLVVETPCPVFYRLRSSKGNGNKAARRCSLSMPFSECM